MGNSHSSRKSIRGKLSKKKSLQKSESSRQQPPIYDPSRFYLPKNVKDIDRMHEQHFLFKHIWGCNFSSPIEKALHKNSTVLDVGCGPGTWLLEMSTTYPQTKFYGIEIAQIFPKEIKPGNLEFIQSDITNGIEFADDYFDFVRMSLLAVFLQEDKFVRVLRELIRVLKPGGYIEIIEHDLQYNAGPYFSKLVSPLIDFIASTGANVQIMQKIDSLLLTSSTSNHQVSPSSRNILSTSCLTNTPTSISSHQTNVILSNTLSKLTNTHSDTRTVLIGSVHGGQAGKVFEELLKSYFENTVVDLLPWYMRISQEKYSELWKSCQKEFKNHASSTKLFKFWGMKAIE